MRDELRFMKTTKCILVIGAVIALLITCYQMRGAFLKGWQNGAVTTQSPYAYHLPIFDNIVIPTSDSLKIIGNNGFNYHLKTQYLVSGDVYNRSSPQKMFSFLTGFRMAITAAMVVFSILLLLKLYYFIDDSSKGKIFTLENINRIKVIGSYCISLSIASLIWDVCNYFITKALFSHTSFRTAYSFDFNYLLLTVGIVTIVIMQIFKKGYELKQEQDLTV